LKIDFGEVQYGRSLHIAIEWLWALYKNSAVEASSSLKGKPVPLQACSGPEGSRKLRFPDFMSMAQDGGKVVSLTHQVPLPPGNAPDTHFC